MFRKNLTIFVPLRERCFSKLLISSYRPSQNSLFDLGVGNPLTGEKLRVYFHDQHFFVVRPIENADFAALRQPDHAAPEKIVVEFLARGLLETENLATLRIHALTSRA